MKPAAFDYLRPSSRREACELLHEAGDDARLIAGGQSLMAVLNMRLAQPKRLIDIAGIEDLHYIERRDDHLAVGAGVTQAELLEHPGLAEAVPLLAQAMPWIGHWQTRNRGTVCGSIAHADPSAELPLCLAALGGQVVLENRRGKSRRVMAEDFFQGVLTTDRRQDELITEVRFPLARPGAEYRFREVAMRHGDFAIVALAAVVDSDRLTLGVGGVADRPVAREFVRHADPSEALNALAWSLGAEDDAHATAAYRRQLIRELGLELIAGGPSNEENAHARQG
ncbi:FAD binding domain-containing protein [Billgrantia desiderata]|uniref:Carbon monoxide dehydrogenase n=1 Tax=Billgrantia desiderata TaxID=52021 RepID=A0AAW4YQ74_9GAMM|nr:FAD binding domain-containing protein [Halomonas desiderata]MCE8028341.1 carbon monoxide dehydrogenase [Halomonas desiderata]MCE8042861.1 carbon monoxide dehydrogenase [Halomonas desiderata]MCE8047623.1 carbon monoxide dehydrogenase [Halomonas desiderata]MCE8050250.1 carbon monoxide dehydrogenase [Halomonas desiderata]